MKNLLDMIAAEYGLTSLHAEQDARGRWVWAVTAFDGSDERTVTGSGDTPGSALLETVSLLKKAA